uniref:Uncharacterized protein n=1 Tax=mine drainage metagenome TaxID=410659 RepID=E6QD08_9ZZZZ
MRVIIRAILAVAVIEARDFLAGTTKISQQVPLESVRNFRDVSLVLIGLENFRKPSINGFRSLEQTWGKNCYLKVPSLICSMPSISGAWTRGTHPISW